MRKPHILKRNKEKRTPQNVVFFDSESYVQPEITEEELKRAGNGEKVVKPHSLYLIVACFRQNNKYWKIYTKDNGLHEAFWKDVSDFGEKDEPVYIVAHNAKYDVIVTDGIRQLVKYGYKVYAFADDNPFFVKLKNEETKKNIVIISSTNIYHNSLKELGKIFRLEKTEIDYAGDDMEKAIEYCRNDVEILMKAMEEYMKFLQDEDLGNFSITVAGQAFNAYRHRFMNHKIYIHSSESALMLERESYAGGRTEAFKIGKVPGPIYCFDVNSMYPYVMQEYRYPTKLIGVSSTMETADLEDLIKKGYLLISKVLIKVDKPVFFKKAGKLIFSVGEFQTALATPELQYAIKHGYIKKVFRTNIYEAEYIFKEYVNYFYNKRLQAKENRDKVKDLLFKLFLNSLYGKFGQKNNIYEPIGECPVDVIKEEEVFDADTGEYYTLKYFGGNVFKKNNDEFSEAFNSFPAIASHVTSYARMLLWSYIDTAGRENVYYCDTDSLFTNEAGRKNLEKSGVVDPHKLGSLKLEKQTDGIMEIYGVKDYRFNEEIKIKGVNKNAVKLDENRYAVVVWRGLSKYIKNGFQQYENEVMIKELKREYDKGYIKNGKVYPIVYKDDKLTIPDDADNKGMLYHSYKKLIS